MNCILMMLREKGFITEKTNSGLINDICLKHKCSECPLQLNFGVAENLENAPYTKEYISKKTK